MPFSASGQGPRRASRPAGRRWASSASLAAHTPRCTACATTCSATPPWTGGTAAWACCLSGCALPVRGSPQGSCTGCVGGCWAARQGAAAQPACLHCAEQLGRQAMQQIRADRCKPAGTHLRDRPGPQGPPRPACLACQAGGPLHAHCIPQRLPQETCAPLRTCTTHPAQVSGDVLSRGLLLQEVGALLEEVSRLTTQALASLGGAAGLELPRLPLALGEFLEAWVVGSVSGFQNLRHPANLVSTRVCACTLLCGARADPRGGAVAAQPARREAQLMAAHAGRRVCPIAQALYWSHPFRIEGASSHPSSYWGSGPRSSAPQARPSLLCAAEASVHVPGAQLACACRARLPCSRSWTTE